MVNVDATRIGAMYCVNHARKILRTNGSRGPVDVDALRDCIVGRVGGKTLATYCNIIGGGQCGTRWRLRSVGSVDCDIPNGDLRDMWKVHRFITAHRPGAVIAIGQVEAIAWMRRMGLENVGAYIDFLDYLDGAPPHDFQAFIGRAVDFVEELRK